MGRKVTRTKVNRSGSQVLALETVVEFEGGGSSKEEGVQGRREGSQMPALTVNWYRRQRRMS